MNNFEILKLEVRPCTIFIMVINVTSGMNPFQKQLTTFEAHDVTNRTSWVHN